MNDHKYRKKPVVIEAFHLTEETKNNKEPWPNWLLKALSKPCYEIGSFYRFPFLDFNGVQMDAFRIETLEGSMTVRMNDWIIRGVEGELYACEPNIFSKTYEKA